METKGNLQSNSANEISSYLVDTGSTNAFEVALRPVVAAYTSGLKIIFKAANANTGACTLAVNGLTPKTIKKSVSADLAANDILANQIIEVIYDGTNFQILSGAGGTSSSSFDYPQVLFTEIFN